jgi:hypothetical protein
VAGSSETSIYIPNCKSFVSFWLEKNPAEVLNLPTLHVERQRPVFVLLHLQSDIIITTQMTHSELSARKFYWPETKKLSVHTVTTLRIVNMVCVQQSYTQQIYIEKDGFGGLVVSTLATGTRVGGFKPGQSRWIFRASGKSSVCLPSEGK